MFYDRTLLGYHGCDASIAERLLAGDAFQKSQNLYDWLGAGVYFWEYGLDRAQRFAKDQQSRGKITTPAVVGAVLQLGHCFDLLDTRFTQDLAQGYAAYKRFARRKGLKLPKNVGSTPDKKLRKRDCAVLNWYLEALALTSGKSYDTVRGCFLEGGPAFAGSRISKEAHIQIAVRNPACILGVFRPRRTP